MKIRKDDLWKWSPASKKFVMFSHKVPAGFPSPANDFIEKTLSLDDLLIEHPIATFFVKVTGDSMKNAGILSGDTLVVDRSREPTDKCIVVAVVNGELTVKRLVKKYSQIELHAENPSYLPLTFKNEEELVIWGVVVGVVRKV